MHGVKRAHETIDGISAAEHLDGAIFTNHLQNASSLDDLQDLPGLEDLQEALHLRFCLKHVYTFTGSRVLVSTNPYDWEVSLPLYSESQCNVYRSQLHCAGPSRVLPPHLYSIAELARRQRAGEAVTGEPSSAAMRSQTLLVSGESGAGKSEAVKVLLGYLAYHGGLPTALDSQVAPLEAKLLQMCAHSPPRDIMSGCSSC